MTTPLTAAEVVRAVANGDAYCHCGYRKSVHEDGTHHAIDPRTRKCNDGGYSRSISFNEDVMRYREHTEPGLFDEDAT